MDKGVDTKTVEPILVAYIEGNGDISDLNKDIDKLYGYLHNNGLQAKIAGSLIGLFYTEFGGKYIAAVPIKENIKFSNNIQIKTLPKIKCVSSIHKGSYKTIEETFNKLKEYREKNNLEFHFPVREIYIKSDGVEDDYVTEIQTPIEKSE